jgi:hypothetical protein
MTPPREVIDLSEEEESKMPVQEPEKHVGEEPIKHAEEGKAKHFVVPCNDFPRFRYAEISIKLTIGPNDKLRYNYQLHSTTLSRNSTWFRKTLGQGIPEFNLALVARMKREGLAHRYELEYNESSKLWLLVKTVSGISTIPPLY